MLRLLATLALAIGATTALAQSAAAPPRAVPAARPEITLSFSPVVKRAQPAVVNVYASRAAQRQASNPLFDDPVFRHFFGDGGQGQSGAGQQSLGSWAPRCARFLSCLRPKKPWAILALNARPFAQRPNSMPGCVKSGVPMPK